MAKRAQLHRLVWLGLLVVLALAGLGYRLVDLQVLRHDELSAKALLNTKREFLLQPRRGDILDCRGNLLATSIFVKNICADPVLIGTNQLPFARALAPLLQMPEEALVQLLTPRVRQNDEGETVTNQFVTLKKKVPVETWAKIQSSLTNLSFGLEEKTLTRKQREFFADLRRSAIFAQNDQLRTYPSVRLASHVLGYTMSEDKEIGDIPVTDTVGRNGIELTLNEQLAGVRGWRITGTDHKHREVLTLRAQDVEPRDGYNVVLTIDSVIQHIVETALAEAMEKHAPISVSGIVVRPRTGEVLAMATLPDFDPNHPNASSLDAQRNRVITDSSEPGSTFKIVVVSGALNEGLVTLSNTFDCEHGHFYFAGKILHDHGSHGILTVQDIIAKSSNIGAAKIGIKLGQDRLYDYIRKFGFGTPTGLPLPGEVGASQWVPDVSKWSKLSIARIPMGQGIAVTRMQMLMAMAAIANHGVLMRPMLVDRLEDSNHRVFAKYSPQPVRRVINEASDQAIIQALKAVVAPGGTAARAALDHYTVAGKTGTANKVEGGHYVEKYFASFIGFFPADNPELCISITFDEPRQGHFGGDIAAPVFKEIAEAAANYLNIRPEDSSIPSIVEPSPVTVNEFAPKTASTHSP